MKPTEKQIQEIAELLDCGMQIFYQIKNGEIKEIPDFIEEIGDSENLWNDDLQHIEENRNEYYEFEQMSSFDSYKTMADFTERVEDIALKNKLIKALNRPKPFRNFKQQLDTSDTFIEKWYQFKHNSYVQWIRNQIERNEEIFRIEFH